MNLANFSVRRPVLVIMVSLIIIIIGGVSLNRLPIDLMPDISYPTISVNTTYENASPQEIEELLTNIIEEALSAVPGVDTIKSTSLEGESQITVTFNWGTDLDAAASDIRDRLDRILARLPDDVERPMLRKYDMASFPILIFGVASNLDPIQLRRIIDDQVKYRIERLPGVASMDINGGLNREIHVNIMGDKIKALGLSLDKILDRIEAENINIPAGTLEAGNMEVTLRTHGEYTNINELRNTTIAIKDGVLIRLKDVAIVSDHWQKITRIIRVNSRPGIRLAINKQSGTNTVKVAEAVFAEVEKINRDIPQINIANIIDTSDYIKRSIMNVGSSVLYGGVISILVLIIFLRHIPSTAIIATSIPISVIATFGLMYFYGFTLNFMTLGGLALGTGMLVDNAIVVLENIYRLRETGMKAHEAAIFGTEEVTSAIIASTLTTLAVFLPLIFVEGMSGIMFKQLSYMVSFSLGCSLAVSLTLVPMLAARSSAPSSPQKTGFISLKYRSYNLIGQFLTSLENDYKKILGFALKHRSLVVIVAIMLLVGSLMLARFIGVEFMPNTDESEVRVYAEMQVGTRLDLVNERFDYIEEIVKKEVPELKSMVCFIGGSGRQASGSHTGNLRIALKSASERTRSSEEIASFLRKRLNNIPGTTIRTRAGQGLFMLRIGTGGEKIEIEIRGHDFKIADELAIYVKRAIEDVRGITDIQLSRESGSPEELIIVDREKAASMKLTVSQIANMLQTILSGTTAGNYRESGKEYSIRVKMADAEKMSVRDILDLTLTNSDGEPVVLRNVVNVESTTGPVLIQRKDQERIISISVNITGRDMGSILADIREKLRSIPVPRDFSIVFGGDYEEQQKSFKELMLSFILALIIVYMVMACLYESLIDPLVVMFSVPLAAIGVILMLFFTNTTFNVQSFIGCIMLGGIVVNNAILLVDHTNLLRERDGMPMIEAIKEAGKRRLRPILMTSLTTILALIPLALGLGEGGEAQAPMARTVLGGLLSSTLITLIFIPTVYSIFKK